MWKPSKIFYIVCLMLFIAGISFFSRNVLKGYQHYIMKSFRLNGIGSDSVAFTTTAILRQGNGILFMETTDRMEPPPLVLCVIESAARIYPDRPVVYFMKGLGNITTEEEEENTRRHFPTLSSFPNVYFFPLRMDELFNNTPLMTWFKKTDPKKERYWTHVSSDACRFAMIWKYGGIYMDTDVISIRPIPEADFLAGEHSQSTSSAVFGLSPHHNLTWQFMESFVENYRGDKWGHQGPVVFTRLVTKLCGTSVLESKEDTTCANISYFKPGRFYPILYSSWKKYFEVWPNLPTFDNSYALHLWNYMNSEHKSMVPGSNTLVEHLYQDYCPTTYGHILENEKTQI
ncbi:alpha-1,4-N-acetylglucosaminyltransferase-like [Hyperolius riggenbachi]|uniref:alpha-1,4-N-acetylglucosaminyltransferase-like n=1 Tax=Hyperolius riggenbachi TaxID=752182 RepID=UPI0035A2CE6F